MFNSLEIGKRSLSSHKTAMDVTGHNISNANKEGYSRQMVDMQTVGSDHPKFGRVGIGSEVESVKRVRNEFIDDRMVKEKSERAKWDTREINIKHMEYLINEPSDQGIRSSLDEYWRAMQEVSKYPEDMAVRVNLKERAEEMSSSISTTYERFEALRENFDNDIETSVVSINSYLKRLAEINGQISRAEAGDNHANDLRDEFDTLSEELSKIVALKVTRRDGDNIISIGGRVAVQRDSYKGVMIKKDAKVNEGMAQLLWADLKEPVRVENGSLKGLVELRDKESVKYLDYLDELAIGIIDTTNDINRSGFDSKGVQGGQFFENFVTHQLIRDINDDGIEEAMIYKIRGNKAIPPKELLSDTLKTTEELVDENGEPIPTDVPYVEKGKFEINGVPISYNTETDTLEEVILKINKARAGVVAAAGPNNRLIIRALKDEEYYVKTLSQTEGTLLSKLGILSVDNASFDFRESGTITSLSKDSEGVPRKGAAFRMQFAISDVAEIAAAGGTDTTGDGIPDKANHVGDGSNALRMASLKDKKSIGNFTYEEFFKSVISDLGVSSQEAKKFASNQKVLIDNLEKRRQSEIGVSLDEEMANMIKYQHGYDAAAKYMSNVDQMMDTIINKL